MKNLTKIALVSSILLAFAGCKESPDYGSCTFKHNGTKYSEARLCVEGANRRNVISEDTCDSLPEPLFYKNQRCEDTPESCWGCLESYEDIKDRVPEWMSEFSGEVDFHLCGYYCFTYTR